jgi:hypothetical protein
MKPEFDQRLQNASKEHLMHLLQEIVQRHPVLLSEMMSILEGLSSPGEEKGEGDEEDVTEDWDFSGDEQAAEHAFPPQPVSFPLDTLASQQRLEEYATRLRQGESPQTLIGDLSNLVEEAISYIGQNDNNSALDLFALLIDERLLERAPATVSLYDEMIDAAMYSLEALLSETSSNAMFDADTVTLSPLLAPNVRHRWLERLFALWLKRLDLHRVEEDLPEMILDMAWSEDMLLLRSLAQNELQRHAHGEHSNIVDFARQYRGKALEKFLNELPYS